ncbi:MAG: hypothetical protein C0401_05455 [Anaerolinea sp.]|nr:hypothetical protein [Anaerolinea sp.]
MHTLLILPEEFLGCTGKRDGLLPGRVFAIVDVYNALTSDRPYRKAWSKEKPWCISRKVPAPTLIRRS